MKTVDAHFDGKQIVLEEPVKLTAHTKLKVIVAEAGETFSDADLSRWCLRLSEPAFAMVWDNARDAEYEERAEEPWARSDGHLPRCSKGQTQRKPLV
jgi:hypothetical protein